MLRISVAEITNVEAIHPGVFAEGVEGIRIEDWRKKKLARSAAIPAVSEPALPEAASLTLSRDSEGGPPPAVN